MRCAGCRIGFSDHTLRAGAELSWINPQENVRMRTHAKGETEGGGEEEEEEEGAERTRLVDSVFPSFSFFFFFLSSLFFSLSPSLSLSMTLLLAYSASILIPSRSNTDKSNSPRSCTFPPFVA